MPEGARAASGNLVDENEVPIEGELIRADGTKTSTGSLTIEKLILLDDNLHFVTADPAKYKLWPEE
jgi:hypothetical protein